MSGELTAIIIVGTVFIALSQIVRTIAENRIRHKLIDKGMVDENVKYLYTSKLSYNVPSSLKWGMVLIAVGAAIWVAQLVPRSFHEEAIVSGMLIMGGLALIVYYFIASKLFNSSDNG